MPARLNVDVEEVALAVTAVAITAAARCSTRLAPVPPFVLLTLVPSVIVGVCQCPF